MQWWLSTCMPFRYLGQSLKVPLYVESTLFCPWDFPGKNSAVGCHFLLPGILSTPRLKPHLQHWKADSLPLSHLGSPVTQLSGPEFSQNFPWALYRDVMWENSRKLACLDDDNFLPESLIYLLGFGSIISRMFLKISDSHNSLKSLLSKGNGYVWIWKERLQDNSLCW